MRWMQCLKQIKKTYIHTYNKSLYDDKNLYTRFSMDGCRLDVHVNSAKLSNISLINISVYIWIYTYIRIYPEIYTYILCGNVLVLST